MVEIKEILLEIGLSQKQPVWLSCFNTESDLVIITALTCGWFRVCKCLLAGFHVKYHDNRRPQIDPTYIPDKAENFEQGLALIYLAIGK
ncbi:MAG: hypothetical protein IPL09_13970 [Bacteroidetes bacterium]|nr:hypothetical protein [Bacteroidota bacterium]